MSFLAKEHIVARPGYSRWLVPPAALCVHLCIGEVYAFSVFNLPLTEAIGITHQAAADWRLTTLSWIFSLSICMLGVTAWTCGQWVEQVGPRKAMFVAACCFGGGLAVSAFGVWTHQIWLLYLGYGVLGGIGEGIGYISPISTLITWFPDHTGMATGMAIMGFGGGAMIGAPLSVGLMHYFASATSLGVGKTFVVMGLIYFCFMSIGAIIVRIPPEGWLPAGYRPPKQSSKLVTNEQVRVQDAVKTPQFYLLWLVLFLSVTAGVGVLSQASAMAQETFPGAITAVSAAGFVGLLSLFNMGGRFFWASLSDYIGRKNTYVMLFVLSVVLYISVPSIRATGNVTLFVIVYCMIISMCGGGFATAPAYIKDVFGSMHAGAIHGRMLTAVSAAGVLGPVLMSYIRRYQIDAGVPEARAYTVTMYIMATLLAIGLLANLLVHAVDTKHYYRAK
ncbi:MAG: OFA family MFS transporter [Salinisphaera sp.]|uniref:L-lactate MFS transporter n=1 Tax=Salinisphaera sp. TaxID=1914330 RepID=UPI003C7C466F